MKNGRDELDVTHQSSTKTRVRFWCQTQFNMQFFNSIALTFTQASKFSLCACALCACFNHSNNITQIRWICVHPTNLHLGETLVVYLIFHYEHLLRGRIQNYWFSSHVKRNGPIGKIIACISALRIIFWMIFLHQNSF